MKHILIYSIGICMMLQMACKPKPVTDVELPESKQELVLFCFISPEDSLVKASLTLSDQYFNDYMGGPRHYSLDSATIKITSDNGKTAVLKPDAQGDYYIANTTQMPVESGHVYTLEAWWRDKYVSATSQVPSSIINVKGIKTYKVNNQSSGAFNRFEVSWDDETAVSNYYRVYIQKVSQYPGASVDFLYDDSKKSGTLLSLSLDENGGGFESGDSSEYDCFLLNVDYSYYEYHRRRLAYEGSDNPFSEPVPMYSNIKNGLGCFSAYRRSSYHFTVK